MPIKAHEMFTWEKAYEKIPATLRQNFSDDALRDLATFPHDSREIKYFSVGAFFGYQENYLTGTPTDSYQYATSAAAPVAPLSHGKISIASANISNQPLINQNWLISLTDQQVAVAAYKCARQVFETPLIQQSVDIGLEYFPKTIIIIDAKILESIRQSFVASHLYIQDRNIE